MSKPTNIGGLKSLGKATKPIAKVGEYSADPQGGTMPSVPRPGKIGSANIDGPFGKGKKA